MCSGVGGCAPCAEVNLHVGTPVTLGQIAAGGLDAVPARRVELTVELKAARPSAHGTRFRFQWGAHGFVNDRPACLDDTQADILLLATWLGPRTGGAPEWRFNVVPAIWFGETGENFHIRKMARYWEDLESWWLGVPMTADECARWVVDNLMRP